MYMTTHLLELLQLALESLPFMSVAATSGHVGRPSRSSFDADPDAVA